MGAIYTWFYAGDCVQGMVPLISFLIQVRLKPNADKNKTLPL